MKTQLPLKWVEKINPYYWDTLLEDEEIMWNTLWNFDDLQWTEKNANITRECGMIPVEVDGLMFVALGGCGMDLRALVIYTQFKLTDWIEESDVFYLKHEKRDYVEYVLGNKNAKELYEALERKKFI